MLGLVLAIISAIGGSVVYVTHLGEAKCEAKATSAALAALQSEIARVTAIGDSFNAINLQLQADQAAARTASAQRQFETAQVIHEHPLPIACQLDPDLVRLRCESIAALYIASGQPVPGTCPRPPEAARTAGPLKHKG